MAAMTEAELQNEIRLALGKIPGLALWRNNVGQMRVGNRFVHFGLCRGSSDLIGLLNGRFIAAEIKTPRGELTEDQRLFLNLVKRLGGLTFIWRSVNQAVEEIMNAIQSPEIIRDGIKNISGTDKR
jgi:hypothetical protein